MLFRLWQVSGRWEADFESYRRLDLYDVDNWSLTHGPEDPAEDRCGRAGRSLGTVAVVVRVPAVGSPAACGARCRKARCASISAEIR